MPTPYNKAGPPDIAKSTSIVTIIVKEQKHIVHKELICFYSPFFDKAFNGAFIEGSTQEIKLEEVELELFGIFVNFIYTQSLRKTDENGKEVYMTLVDVVSLWGLAEQWLCKRLQDKIILEIGALPLANTTVAKNKNDLISASRAAFRHDKDKVLQDAIVSKVVNTAGTYPEELESWTNLYPMSMLQQLFKKQRSFYDAKISTMQMTIHDLHTELDEITGSDYDW
ncbi:hypothetical protein BJ878DRAFT_509713 [Calycina marina]|uniref:BTB domain-containing protein n=1 Tax=Calycina marina TaxID=1763456 RepID=A0A9P8CE32_9HELO|nr:hypothetical protein BJ878DRAFT_509713 [Calycina marina]